MNNNNAYGKIVDYHRRGLYPCEMIYRLLTLNHKEESAQPRQIGVQYYDSKFYVAHDFNRDSLEEFKQRMNGTLRVPESLHMAFYKEKNEEKLVALKKELVFDMDITDFVRFCPCEGKKQLCQVCWLHIAGAHLILDEMLQAWHGYEARHLLWVFSGGKGLHCLVNSPLALSLGDTERMRLYDRMYVDPTDDEGLLVKIRQFEPTFLDRLMLFFVNHAFKECDLFNIAGPEQQGGETFEAFCLRHLQKRYPALYVHVKKAWEAMRESGNTNKKAKHFSGESACEENLSTRKWSHLQALVKMQNGSQGCRADVFLMMRVLFPMVDKEPLRMMHQIKLPFSIHSTSKNIALPLDSDAIVKMNVVRDPLSLDLLLKNKQPHPQFTKARNLFGRWLDQY